MSEEKFDVECFEKLKAAFNEYEAERKERFKNFSVGLLKSSKVPQEVNVSGVGKSEINHYARKVRANRR